MSRRLVHASRVVLLASAAVLCLALPVGCGDDDDDFGTGPLSMSAAETLCNDSCEHEVMCDATTVMAECVTECVGFAGGGAIRGDAASTIVSCETELACDVTDDTCQDMVQPLPAHTSYAEDCAAKATECGATAPPPFCKVEFVKLFTTTVTGELSACIAMTCEQLQDCLGTVFAKYGLTEGA